MGRVCAAACAAGLLIDPRGVSLHLAFLIFIHLFGCTFVCTFVSLDHIFFPTHSLRDKGTKGQKNFGTLERWNFGTWELWNLGTWDLGNLGNWELGNLGTWELKKPLGKKKSRKLSGQKKITQHLGGEKKLRKLSGQQKTMQPLGTTKSRNLFEQKKSRNLSGQKKSRNLLGKKNKKTRNLLGPKKNYATSWDKKSRNLSGQKKRNLFDKKITQPLVSKMKMNSPRIAYIVPFGKFHRFGGAPSETFPSIKYDAPEEVGGNRIFFYSPIIGNEVWSKFFMLIVQGP